MGTISGSPGAGTAHDSAVGGPRLGGYVPLREYAVIGDGRTAALIARDGSVDWLGLPDLDSPAVFGAVLDAGHGGRFTLEPTVPYRAERRYLPHTNVLQTTFSTARGAVGVTDALTLHDETALTPMRELLRRIDGLSGSVPMRWSVRPRFGYGLARTRFAQRSGVPVATADTKALAVCSWDAGAPECDGHAISGTCELPCGRRALIAMPFADQEPLVLPARTECEARLDDTCAAWRRWARDRMYPGRWSEAVMRSLLTLKLLVHAPSGAVAAAVTTSLPERIGGERNWDYRFSWVRDSAFTLAAFLRLGCPAEAHAYFWWLMHASQLTHPHLKVLYRLDGGHRTPERTLPWEGHRGSGPVRTGNAAVGQLQLDTYGELLQTAWQYARAAGHLDADVARRLAELADLVCTNWRQPDAGIWEVRSQPRHFTQSKMMCWVALDRAADLAEHDLIPGRHLARWRTARDQIRAFVETHCFSDSLDSYVRSADSPDLDAAVLLGHLYGYRGDHRRMDATISTLADRLRQGPYVERYSGEDGLSGGEGAFLACSFWLAESLARTGRRPQAVDLMEELVGLANDVGLYSEEIDPATGDFLGNLPQGLSHLALISAACAIGAADDTGTAP
ncbi:glycoside hydrolase family 15 protein [Streptomyces ipomoeae]|uniref:Glycosyl hydrolase, family 15 n=2 Tax=Streptomyces ipomoeae TaxID=103232 RepID=L1L5Z3_9ACTN|nr:glycoside hydrolase family 15 protein [Streptomyces ipomoeae]EKX68209.1 glycosyl hydrolase, family 15 [Streptomyces ipomoeae 91-03]MDX2692404.1 glycoside hydrolase family 15 protein [Streptomyces ipomoeae]MDX2819778.1 glycoside hydrolase family 15 protein [Streptomyces ipomoeae]MDX2838072.1 glycoside hydrolase family 15 protein [Streptomyces ipomoeae]MDX2872404.1 glycoside hydrolase family 15 protein [Streptomyces ipomoeae]